MSAIVRCAGKSTLSIARSSFCRAGRLRVGATLALELTPARPRDNVRGQKTVRCMIGLATLSLLATCPHPAEGLPAAPSPPQNAAGSVSGGVGAGTIVSLPRQAGPWVRPDAPRRITDETIFDYMDGAGELYLAYRFEYLDVYRYLGAGEEARHTQGRTLLDEESGRCVRIAVQRLGRRSRRPPRAGRASRSASSGALARRALWRRPASVLERQSLRPRHGVARIAGIARAGAGNRQVDRQRAALEWSAAGDPVEDPGPVGGAPRPATRPHLLLPVALRAQLGVLPGAE